MRDIVRPIDFQRRAFQSIVPAMRYTPEEDFFSWQTRARQKLGELLGMDQFIPCDPMPETEFVHDLGDHTDERFTFRSEDGYFVPCRMLTPKTPSRGFMICLQGHSTGMHNSLGEKKYPGDAEDQENGDRDFAVQALAHGFTAIALEQRCFGECGGTPNPDCSGSSMLALLRGRTTIGERVWDVSALIRLLNDRMNENRLPIYVMGNSGGGTASFYAACWNTALAGAIPSCSVCTYADSIVFRRHCECNYIPGIAKYFDMGDLSGLIAPRPYVQVSGRDDHIFLLKGAQACFEETKRLYAAADAADNCRFVVGAGGHRFYAEDAWNAFEEILAR